MADWKTQRGPWSDEPDALDWIDDATGFPCAIRRHPKFGHLCGYVGVPKDHPWYGKSYSEPVKAAADVMERPVDVDEIGAINLFCASARSCPDEHVFPIDVLVRCHGGLTYSGNGYWEGETRASHWFGFDASHCDDLAPGLGEYMEPRGVYRTMDFMRDACTKAAADLAAAPVSSSQAASGVNG